MTGSADNPHDRTTRWLRWLARGTGSLVAAFWLLVGIAHAIGDPTPFTLEAGILTLLFTASIAGVALAWWREGIGGIVLVVCGVAHAVFALLAAGHNHAFAMLISGGPFLVVGVLFFACRRRSS